MLKLLRCLFLFLLAVSSEKKFPIVYFYTVGPYSCKHGLPHYITISIEQAVISQPDCDIIMASNYQECATVEAVIDKIPTVIKFDTSIALASNRTRDFVNASEAMFEANFNGELWATSAIRFFGLEDLMISMNYTEMIHVEADNLLYGKMTSILPVLRTKYKGLAATPLNSNKSFITSSVLWIASLGDLSKFNDFMLALGRNTNNRWRGYLDWLRPYGCCKAGGIDPDKNGNGIKPFAINEMSMLAYYHELFPTDFHLLPVIPTHPYVLNKYICNLTDFSPIGAYIPAPTGEGIWDPNSWGQFLGGTSSRRGRDKGFTDASHIAGQAMRTNFCRPQMICSNNSIHFLASVISETTMISVSSTSGSSGGVTTTIDQQRSINNIHGSRKRIKRSYLSPLKTEPEGGVRLLNDTGLVTKDSTPTLSTPTITTSIWENVTYCYTAPYVRCDGQEKWTPLWNLHVHSKHTIDYKSMKCVCPS